MVNCHAKELNLTIVFIVYHADCICKHGIFGIQKAIIKKWPLFLACIIGDEVAAPVFNTKIRLIYLLSRQAVYNKIHMHD